MSDDEVMAGAVETREGDAIALRWPDGFHIGYAPSLAPPEPFLTKSFVVLRRDWLAKKAA